MAAADMACWARRRTGAGTLARTVPINHFQIDFSPDFQTQVHKSLNIKVVHQTTLYKIARSSRMF
jgi:hypothetical protein